MVLCEIDMYVASVSCNGRISSAPHALSVTSFVHLFYSVSLRHLRNALIGGTIVHGLQEHIVNFLINCYMGKSTKT